MVEESDDSARRAAPAAGGRLTRRIGLP